jgi:hypothetical protein
MALDAPLHPGTSSCGAPKVFSLVVSAQARNAEVRRLQGKNPDENILGPHNNSER